MTPEEIFTLCGQIVAVIGIAFLFFDAIMSIIKKRNIRLSIVALVFLSLAVILFLVGQFVLDAGLVGTVITILSIVFLLAYIVCYVLIVFGNAKLRKKQLDELTTATEAENNEDNETEQNNDESEA